jgi:hypothetical protein
LTHATGHRSPYADSQRREMEWQRERERERERERGSCVARWWFPKPGRAVPSLGVHTFWLAPPCRHFKNQSCCAGFLLWRLSKP